MLHQIFNLKVVFNLPTENMAMKIWNWKLCTICKAHFPRFTVLRGDASSICLNLKLQYRKNRKCTSLPDRIHQYFSWDGAKDHSETSHTLPHIYIREPERLTSDLHWRQYFEIIRIQHFWCFCFCLNEVFDISVEVLIMVCKLSFAYDQTNSPQNYPIGHPGLCTKPWVFCFARGNDVVI